MSDSFVAVEVTGRKLIGQSPSLVPVELQGSTGPGMLPYSSLGLPVLEFEDQTLLLTTRPFRDAPGATGRMATHRLLNGGRVTRTIPIDPLSPARTRRALGDVKMADADGQLEAWFSEFDVRGQTVSAFVGNVHEAFSQASPVYSSTALNFRRTRTELILEVQDPLSLLDVPFQRRTYGGAGGRDGDSAIEGIRRPTGFGRVRGAAPVLVSRADNIYQLHDGEIQAVNAVYEGGVPYSATSDYVDYEALVAATVTAGNYATCLAEGYLRIGTNLEGLVYALQVDFEGALDGSTFLDTHGEILEFIIRNRGNLGNEQIDSASFASLVGGTISYYDDGANDRLLGDIVNELLLSAGAALSYDSATRLRAVSLVDPLSGSVDHELNGRRLRDWSTEFQDFDPSQNVRTNYAPTASPVERTQIAEGATDDNEARLTTPFSATINVGSTFLATRSDTVPELITFFDEQGPARVVGQSVVETLSSRHTEARLTLERDGLGFIPGDLVDVTNAPFVGDGQHRALVYEQEVELSSPLKVVVTTFD